MSLPFLQTLGLTKNEADLYELLLRLGEAPMASILKEIGDVKRPTLYKSLYSLEKKGLITKKDLNKKIHFRPEPPTHLLSLADEQYNSLDRAKADLKALIPQLTSTYITSVEKPVVTTYEGVEGLKQMYEDTLREGKTIYAALLPSDVDPELLKYLRNNYRKRRAEAGIHAYVIAASNEHAQEYHARDAEFARTSRIVPQEKFPFQHEIDIYGNKVAFINYKAGQPLIGVIINHPSIAITMRALFDLAWEAAESQTHEEVR